jgi:tRNA modification GTPase
MFSTDDTIVAISTPLGRGGLGVVRLSGPQAAPIASRLIRRIRPLRPRHATFAKLALSPSSSSPDPRLHGVGDQVVVTLFAAPHSATGEDVVEISAHGSPVVLEGIVRAALQAGARLAAAGEFTLRAFLHGKLDLIQSEAVADLVDAVTPRQARAAFDQLEGTLTMRIGEVESALFDLVARLEASLDFPDEGYHFVQRDAAGRDLAVITASIDRLLASAEQGRLIREGAQIAIVGTPNVGKSSVFNALLNTNRAIVTPIPGTTRDLLTERADIRGIAVSLVDTAGIREPLDVVEKEGIVRAKQAASVADLSLIVLDRSRPLRAEDRALLAEVAPPRLVIANKADLAPAWTSAEGPREAIEISAMTGAGVDLLRDRLALALGVNDERRDTAIVSNIRHIELLRQARAALGDASDALGTSAGGVSEEFVLADLQRAAVALQDVTGRRTTDDLLAHIFSRFCIGK